MSLVELRQTGRSEAVSGGAMDRVVERKRIDPRLAVRWRCGRRCCCSSLMFWLFAPRADSLTVAATAAIATAQSGTFDDFLPLRARVTPLVTVYLDAVEGGRVEKKLVEDGAQVTQGQLLAVLSNAELQLSTLEKQAEVEQQLNNMRSQELALTQTRNTNLRDLNQAETDLAKMRRQYDLQKPLADRGFVSSKTFNDTKDDLNYQQQRLRILQHSIAQTEALQTSQLQQLRAASSSLNSSMGVAQSSLGQLNIRAPVTGQLSGFDIQLGQSLQQGERIGQIDSAGADKLQADVDEFYLGRVAVGQTASADVDGKTYRLKVVEGLSAGPQRPVPDRPGVPRRRAGVGPARTDGPGQADHRRFIQGAADPERRVLQRHRRQLGVRRRPRRQQRDQASGPARPPQHRFHRGARRAQARRARDHLLLQRPYRQGPPELQLRRVRKEHASCSP